MNGIPVLLIGGKKESGKSTVAKVCEEKFGGFIVSFAAPMKRFCAALGMPVDNLWGSTAKRDEVIATPDFFLTEPDVKRWDRWEHSHTFVAAMKEHFQPVFGHDTVAWQAVAKWCWSEWAWVNGHGESPAHPFTCRHALQTLGTECGRSINPDCWGNFGVDVALKVLTGEYAYDQRIHGITKKERLDAPQRMVVIDDCRFPNELLIGKVKGAKGIYVERPSTDAHAGSHASETSLDAIPGNWWDTSVRNAGTLADLQHAVAHKMNALGFTNGLQNSI